MRRLSLTLTLGITSGLLLLSSAPLWAYWNVGAHPAINECALRVWMDPIVEGTLKGPDKLLNDYLIKDVKKLRKLVGLTVTEPGRWHYDIQEGDKDQSFFEWVKDGGYTADEPEWFQSLRHFYDPYQPEGERYLKDINTLAQCFVWLQKKRGDGPGGREDISLEQPMMDARHWAIRGTNTSPAKLPDNPYAWERGLENMGAAFALTNPKEKDIQFARAWRVLGETMHLLADMTLPAHVRDDAHPLRPYAGPLRTDPYEDVILENEVQAVFKQLSRDPNTARLDLPTDIDQRLMDRINRAENPDELFHAIATYTNANFFSADTVSGRDPATGELMSPVVGSPYPSPKLDECRYELGVYTKTIKGFGRGGTGTRDVMMLRDGAEKPSLMDYLRRVRQDRPKVAVDTTYDCCMSQARVLLPIAFAGNAKLADWFIPRVVVRLQPVDYAKKALSGTVTHQPYGAYTRPLLFASGKESVELLVNGRPAKKELFELSIKAGVIEGDLTRLNLKPADKVSLVLDLGGIPVRSSQELGVSVVWKGYPIIQVAPSKKTEIPPMPEGGWPCTCTATVSGGVAPYRFAWKVVFDDRDSMGGSVTPGPGEEASTNPATLRIPHYEFNVPQTPGQPATGVVLGACLGGTLNLTVTDAEGTVGRWSAHFRGVMRPQQAGSEPKGQSAGGLDDNY